MSDPDRLIAASDTPEARLLASALDEPPPADLMARTLAALDAAGAAAAVGAAGGAGGAVAAKAAGGGVLGAAAIGAIAGVIAVAGYSLVTRAPEPAPVAPAVVAAAAPASAAPAPAASAAPTPQIPAPTPRADPERGAPAPPAPASSPVAPPSATARPDTLAAEIELIDEARRALDGGDAARARALLDRYAREIPHGQLAREAASLRALADAAGRNNP
jgi:hypothetical protein